MNVKKKPDLYSTLNVCLLAACKLLEQHFNSNKPPSTQLFKQFLSQTIHVKSEKTMLEFINKSIDKYRQTLTVTHYTGLLYYY